MRRRSAAGVTAQEFAWLAMRPEYRSDEAARKGKNGRHYTPLAASIPRARGMFKGKCLCPSACCAMGASAATSASCLSAA